MTTPRYLLAKYIADLRRGEPRNIGVIVWTPERIEARFIGEKAGRPGEVDGRSIPPFVTSPQAYKQWVEYWRLQLASEAISPATGGPPVRRDQEGYLAAVMESNKGNFALVDAGFLLDRVAPDDLGALANYLFETLVDTTGEEPQDATLDDVVDRLLDRTGVRQVEHFRTQVEVRCAIGNGQEERFEFDYGYKNGTLKRLYQRVPLPRRRKVQQMRVDATAWKFDRVNESGVLGVERPVAMIYPSDEQRADGETQRMLAVLQSVGRLLDLHDVHAAEAEFRSLIHLQSD